MFLYFLDNFIKRDPDQLIWIALSFILKNIQRLGYPKGPKQTSIIIYFEFQYLRT